MGHMNVMWYVGKFDEATWSLLAHIGLTAQHLRSANRGMAAAHQEIDYLSEVLAGDIVSIDSTLLEVRPKSIKFRHRMLRFGDARPAAVTTIVGVHIDAGLRASVGLPLDIFDRAQALVEPSP
jgi:acyl-CoA thioester hydrolase